MKTIFLGKFGKQDMVVKRQTVLKLEINHKVDITYIENLLQIGNCAINRLINISYYW